MLRSFQLAVIIMVLRQSLARQLHKSLQILQAKPHPFAQWLVRKLRSFDLKVRDTKAMTYQDALTFYDEPVPFEQFKKTVDDDLAGGYCFDDFVYVKSTQSEEDFLNTLVHEGVHYYLHQNKIEFDYLEEELLARVLPDCALGGYLTRYRLKRHIQEMKEGEYFSENKNFEQTNLEQVDMLIARAGLSR